MKKILVIEDDKSIRETITDILELEGYDWLEAENGKAGIIKAVESVPDLIICDVMMPEMNGHEVLEELKKNPLTDNIPFIFLTAMAEKKDLRRGMDLGADDYLTKPFTNEEIINAINSRIQKSSGVKKKLDGLRSSIAHSLPHELRTPLVSILGYSEMLKDNVKQFSPDQIEEYARTINNAGIRLNRLIQNYILYTKIDVYASDNTSGFSKAPKAKIDAQLVQKVLKKTAVRYGREDDLVADIEDTELPILYEYINKIIEELTDNAFKFSDPGTKVVVKNYNENGNYVITVCDDGRGMNHEQLANIGAYQQFERRKYEQQGSGLGLYLAKRLAEIHNGQLNITSEYGAGTFVIVKLPV